MSTLPDFTGPGFFAGEAPDGLTTVVSTPQPAEVRVYWRDPADPEAEDVLVASTLSASNGTWRIDNLNPELQYVVRGRKVGFDDVTVVGATPSRTDVVTVEDHLQQTAEFDGLGGYVLMDSGLTPFTATVIDPLPFGLSPVIDGRKLLIEGTSDDEGIWQSMVRVAASNAVTVDVPVQVVIGLKAPVVTLRYGLDGDRVITLQLAGGSAFADELRVYRSTSAIDADDLPLPVAVLRANAVKWVDDNVEHGSTYFYRVEAVRGGYKALGAEVSRAAAWEPLDMQYPPAILFDDRSQLVVASGLISEIKSSSSDITFDQSTVSRRPQLIEGGLAGKRVMRFLGTASLQADAAGRALYSGVSEGWMFLLAKKTNTDASATSRRLFVCNSGASGARFGVYWDDAVAGAQNRIVSGGRRLDSNSWARVPSTRQSVNEWELIGAHAKWASNSLVQRLNGVVDGTNSSPWPSAGVTSATVPTEFGLGAASTGLAGWIGEVAVCAAGVGEMSVADWQRLEGWSAHSFGLASKLPADHPYKLTPP